MGSDRVLQSCLLLLGAAVFAVGVATFSFKKMMATYAFGLLAIAGLVLPDWEFFDRDFSQWFSPMPGHRTAASDRTPRARRFIFYPMRVALITTIYCFGLYKWWMIVTS